MEKYMSFKRIYLPLLSGLVFLLVGFTFAQPAKADILQVNVPGVGYPYGYNTGYYGNSGAVYRGGAYYGRSGYYGRGGAYYGHRGASYYGRGGAGYHRGGYNHGTTVIHHGNVYHRGHR